MDLRSELQEWWLTPGGKAVSQNWSASRSTKSHIIPPVGDIEVMKLGIAAPYYVTSEMVGMIQVAAESMPETEFHPKDLPSEAGFALLSKPLTFIDIHGQPFKWTAFAWALTGSSPDPDQAHGIHLTTYTHREHDDSGFFEMTDAEAGRVGWRYPTLSLIHETTWGFGRSYTGKEGFAGGTVVNQDLPMTEEAIEGTIAGLRQIHTFFLLAQQRIAHPTLYSASRAVRKRVGRSDPNRPIPEVRVITLRRYREKSESDEPVGESVEWTHRWIVNGFWRKQWYPSEGRHKPKWIAPFVKGPKDKPLVIKDTTFLFKR